MSKGQGSRGAAGGKQPGIQSRPDSGAEEIRLVPRVWLRPAKLNDRIYKPVSPNDPSIRALAESMRKDGVLVPLVVTRDYVILSGHRRRVAARLAGIERVPCYVKDFLESDPDFPR